MSNAPGLSDTVPENPMFLLKTWLDQATAKKVSQNPNSMTLATVSNTGGLIQPQARVVLCKQLKADPGYVVFYTNYQSAKGNELAQTPLATAVFHWDTLQVQARLHGPVEQTPAQESDAYFATRSRGSQLGAWASEQSQGIESRSALLRQLEQIEHQFSHTEDVPRPPHWGGYRIWAQTLELWTGAKNRLHDRIRWQRQLVRDDSGEFHPQEWVAMRLQP